MDIGFAPEDERFRAEFRAWLGSAVPDEWREAGFWSRIDPDEAFALRREWDAAKADAGWSGVDWPVEYGGRGGTAVQRAIHDDELIRASAPKPVNTIATKFLGPTVLLLGTEHQKRELLRPILRCERIWCQGFSEPEAGSDLAGIRCRAVLDGADYVLNGQKVWTTGVMRADWAFLLARTDPDAGRHGGLTFLLVDLATPGIERRPIRQLPGGADFGEVFFTDARVPASQVVGTPGDGWRVALTLLAHERGGSTLGQYRAVRKEWDALASACGRLRRGNTPVADDPESRQRLAGSLVDIELLRLHAYHVLTQVEQGRELGHEASITKLHHGTTRRALSDTWAEVLGAAHQVSAPVPGMDLEPLRTAMLHARSDTIWGGSAEVQRTVIAQRVLGLPKEHR
ncbi:acyl-CoA dehydrogenase family protein [Amycolatopsis sp. CA-230715]|uniref:acyl-CoA dehydrogenase family protein n=1 Tax=Amycolatopsis sp. CA-230715 TaxID=2745196 RepID=UPI001C01676E|nr:acyl-CoA dehydrogenase family protein [Amycolatopsis sp. CA-230715]QWF84852.1 Putative acyl-CoA dehydrogenase FadE17 [Amycolatopsis sp. CA-230715]